MTKAAIMQPTYLPWCGYFGLIDIVDKIPVIQQQHYKRRRIYKKLGYTIMKIKPK